LREFLVMHRSAEQVEPAIGELLAKPEVEGSLFRAASTGTLTLHQGHTLVATRRFDPGDDPEGADTFLHGLAVADGRLIDREASVPPGDPVALVERARGAFALVSWDAGRVVVCPDILGVYPIWHWSDGDRFVCSNNTHLIVTALAEAGVPVRRNPFNSAWQLIYQAGVAESTGYEGVEWVPFGHHISIGPAEDGDRAEARIAPYPSVAGGWPYRSELPRDELLEMARAEITENVSALTAHSFRARVADLTGGYDSRLMLAVIIGLGLEDEYAFNTDGGAASPDANVAARLRERFGLQRAVLARRPWSPAAEYLTNLRRILFRGYGCFFQNVSMGIGLRCEPGLLHMNGGCGEDFRSLFAKQVQGTKGLTPRGLLDRQIRHRGGEVLTPEAVERLRTMMDSLFEAHTSQGIDEFEAGDRHYLEHRARMFFGPQARARLNQWGAAYPLYSPAGVAAAFATEAVARRANLVEFRLIESLEPALLTEPFADDPWPPEVYEGHPQREALERIAAIQTHDPPLVSEGFEDPETVIELPTYELGGEPNPPPTEWQERMRAEGKHWMWVRLDQSREVLREVVHGPGDLGRIGEVFDLDKMRALADRPLDEFDSNTDVRLVHRTVGAMMWLTGQETVTQLEL
jgi:hypothetical protein